MHVKNSKITMMTSSNGNTFRVTGPLCGEFTGPGEFPTQRPVTRSFDVYFDLRLNKRLSKQSWGWWFETLSSSLWRHRNAKALPIRWSTDEDTVLLFCVAWWIYMSDFASTNGTNNGALEGDFHTFPVCKFWEQMRYINIKPWTSCYPVPCSAYMQ